MQLIRIRPLAATALLASALLWQPACKYEQIDDSTPVCYETEIQPLITSNCTKSGCHNPADHESGRDYTTYQGIMEDVKPGNFKGSKLYKVLIKDRASGSAMPQPPNPALTAAQIQTVAEWIKQGANETFDCASSACDTAAVTYSGSVKPLLELYCTGCHGGSNPQGNINLSNWAGTKAEADKGSLVGSVAWTGSFSQMPKNGSKLSACQISTIEKWVAAGAPNN